MRNKSVTLLLILATIAFGAVAEEKKPDLPEALLHPWKGKLAHALPLYGHRNWIVIADSAYPAQNSPGIETIVTRADQLEVVKTVLEELAKQPHVSPIVYTDAELPHVPEADAPGIGKYREELTKLLGNQKIESMPHEQIIGKLDEAGKTFKVLILKTNLAIPYTSVFFQLDCKYWNADAEKRLREAMAK